MKNKNNNLDSFELRRAQYFIDSIAFVPYMKKFLEIFKVPNLKEEELNKIISMPETEAQLDLSCEIMDFCKKNLRSGVSCIRIDFNKSKGYEFLKKAVQLKFDSLFSTSKELCQKSQEEFFESVQKVSSDQVLDSKILARRLADDLDENYSEEYKFLVYSDINILSVLFRDDLINDMLVEQYIPEQIKNFGKINDLSIFIARDIIKSTLRSLIDSVFYKEIVFIDSEKKGINNDHVEYACRFINAFNKRYAELSGPIRKRDEDNA